MAKTIEEAAKQFTDELFAGDDLTDFDTQTEKNDAYVMCMAFGNHLMSLPLSQRLTDEEREMVKSIRLKFYDKWLNHQDECNEAVYCAVKSMLESIFGKELFGEE